MKPSSEVDTGEFPVHQTRFGDQPETYSALVRVDVAGHSHTGKVRAKNEDHFLITRFGRFLETIQSNLPEGTVAPRSEEGGYGMVVADGIGGSAAGEEASRLAIASLVNLVLRTPDWILRLDDESLSREVLRRASERYEQVNQSLIEKAERDPRLSGFGTTMTFAASLGRDLFVAHLGDSRVYLLRWGRLQQITRDHTLVQSLVDQQLLDRRKAASHRLRNVLSQSLGDHYRPIEPQVTHFTLDNDDRLLLCTDGLTEMVEERVIAEILGGNEPADVVCKKLVDRALDAGGKDNVTVIVARYHLP